MEILTTQRQQQHLTLTPSLRLALEVLRMPLMELRAYLHQQLEENPLLEETSEPSESSEPGAESPQTEESTNGCEEEFVELWRQSEGILSQDKDEEEPPWHGAGGRIGSLYDHLIHQLRSVKSETPIQQAAEALLDWLESDGYLKTPLEEIARALGLEPAQMEQALALIQQCDPPGIGARSLPECLLLQLAHRKKTETLAFQIVRDHFPLLLKRRFNELASSTHVSLSEVEEAARAIAQLDPRPARNFSAGVAPPLVPDFIIRYSKNGSSEVELNDDDLPQLGLSSFYLGLLRNPSTDPEGKAFIREKMRQGIWLRKAIDQRNTTLLAIARCLVQLEKEYFSNGVHHLKPLTQEQVAHMIGCHPSTVSRAVSGKSIQTPYGVLPLEAFFGGGIAHPTEEGKRLSSQTIQAEIQTLISSEDPAQPLSDHALTQHLVTRGLPVARRTVAKYRTQLNILPARFRHHPR